MEQSSIHTFNVGAPCSISGRFNCLVKIFPFSSSVLKHISRNLSVSYVLLYSVNHSGGDYDFRYWMHLCVRRKIKSMH